MTDTIEQTGADDEPEPEWCSACNGSGIGRPSFHGPDYDRCHVCKGRGFIKEEPEPPEFERGDRP